VQYVPRWSGRNDEECKLFHNFIPCRIISYILPKRQISQTLYSYNTLPNLGIEISYSAIKRADNGEVHGTQKVTTNGGKQHRFNQSLHPTYHSILFGSSVHQ
jgi:hypothetical protein